MDERLRILELIEAGEISAEEGARRLEMLAETVEAADAADTPATPVVRPALVRILWQAVFWTGVGLVAGGGLLVTAIYAWEVATGWLICGGLLLTLGVLGLVLGWWLQRAHWLSLRVRQADGPNISFAFPLPLGLVAWGLRIARSFVPQLEVTGVDELLLAMQGELRDGRSFLVEVDEGEDGERVQVYFG